MCARETAAHRPARAVGARGEGCDATSHDGEQTTSPDGAGAGSARGVGGFPPPTIASGACGASARRDAAAARLASDRPSVAREPGGDVVPDGGPFRASAVPATKPLSGGVSPTSTPTSSLSEVSSPSQDLDSRVANAAEGPGARSDPANAQAGPPAAALADVGKPRCGGSATRQTLLGRPTDSGSADRGANLSSNFSNVDVATRPVAEPFGRVASVNGRVGPSEVSAAVAPSEGDVQGAAAGRRRVDRAAGRGDSPCAPSLPAARAAADPASSLRSVPSDEPAPTRDAWPTLARGAVADADDPTVDAVACPPPSRPAPRAAHPRPTAAAGAGARFATALARAAAPAADRTPSQHPPPPPPPPPPLPSPSQRLQQGAHAPGDASRTPSVHAEAPPEFALSLLASETLVEAIEAEGFAPQAPATHALAPSSRPRGPASPSFVPLRAQPPLRDLAPPVEIPGIGVQGVGQFRLFSAGGSPQAVSIAGRQYAPQPGAVGPPPVVGAGPQFAVPPYGGPSAPAASSAMETSASGGPWVFLPQWPTVQLAGGAVQPGTVPPGYAQYVPGPVDGAQAGPAVYSTQPDYALGPDRKGSPAARGAVPEAARAAQCGCCCCGRSAGLESFPPPERFAGSPAHVESFIEETFLHMATNYVRQPERLRVRFAATRLQGRASDWWTLLDPRPTTLDDFFAALREEFGRHKRVQDGAERVGRGGARAVSAAVRPAEHAQGLQALQPVPLQVHLQPHAYAPQLQQHQPLQQLASSPSQHQHQQYQPQHGQALPQPQLPPQVDGVASSGPSETAARGSACSASSTDPSALASGAALGPEDALGSFSRGSSVTGHAASPSSGAVDAYARAAPAGQPDGRARVTAAVAAALAPEGGRHVNSQRQAAKARTVPSSPVVQAAFSPQVQHFQQPQQQLQQQQQQQQQQRARAPVMLLQQHTTGRHERLPRGRGAPDAGADGFVSHASAPIEGSHSL